AEDVGAAPPGREAEHQECGCEKANSDGEERRDRLACQLDPEIGRAPDDVDRPERDPDPGGVAHPPTLHGPAKGARHTRRIRLLWTPIRKLHASSSLRRSPKGPAARIASSSPSSAGGST